jgi:hypothetical protein
LNPELNLIPPPFFFKKETEEKAETFSGRREVDLHNEVQVAQKENF